MHETSGAAGLGGDPRSALSGLAMDEHRASAAYHAAGHAVAGIAFGLRRPFMPGTTWRPSSPPGPVSMQGLADFHDAAPPAEGLVPPWCGNARPAWTRHLRQLAITRLAGPSAERRFTGRAPVRGGLDHDRTFDVAVLFRTGSRKAARQRVDVWTDETDRLVGAAWWSAVEAVAGALGDRPELSGEELWALVEGKLVPPAPDPATSVIEPYVAHYPDPSSAHLDTITADRSKPLDLGWYAVLDRPGSSLGFRVIGPYATDTEARAALTTWGHQLARPRLASW